MDLKQEGATIPATPIMYDKDSVFHPNNQVIDTELFSDIENDIKLNISKLQSEKRAGLFRVRTANETMNDAKMQPEPRILFHPFMVEGDNTICFADTNVGKSVIAMQIANEISKTDKVLYIDLEQSDKQFQGRYSNNYKDDYIFDDKLLRIDFNRMFSIPEGSNYNDFFMESLILLIEETGAKIVILDNMTKLITSDTDKAQTAKPLMDRLTDLKFKYGLSMLLLEHSRKTEMYRPLSINDLQGSKMKVNFADAVFAIGRSAKDPSIRYIKQLKCRSTEMVYNEDKVTYYEIVKENSFLHFKLIGESSEYEHLKQRDENDKSLIIQQVKDLSATGMPQRQIAQKLGISLGTVNNYLKLP